MIQLRSVKVKHFALLPYTILQAFMSYLYGYEKNKFHTYTIIPDLQRFKTYILQSHSFYSIMMCAIQILKCPRSVVDSTRDSGSLIVGSNPAEGATQKN